MNAYLDAMRRYADFTGRSTRSQFWLFSLTLFLIVIGLTVVDGALGLLGPDGYGVFNAIAILAHLVPSLSLGVRRLHDIDRSGWWVLIGLVPLVGLIVLLVFYCTPSTPGANRFGGLGTGHAVNPAPAHPLAPQTSAAAPSAAFAVSPSGAIPLDQLERLSALRASGTITDEEFATMKASVLAGATRGDRQ